MRKFTGVAVLAAILLLAATCGTSTNNNTDQADGAQSSGTDDNLVADRVKIVVTTAVLGDVVENLVGEAFQVETIMPSGVAPHDFQASARQAESMQNADLLVVNGGGFEEGLLNIVNMATRQGVTTFTALEFAEPLFFDHADEHQHGSDESGHPESGLDPHFFTDPARMALVAEALVDLLTEQYPIQMNAQAVANTESYIKSLHQLDKDVEHILAAVPVEQRKMLTNHAVFGYFAERYDFEIVESIIPGGGISEGVGAEHLAKLVALMKSQDLDVIFVDRGATDRFAKVLQGELPGVMLVELYSETLGDKQSDAASYEDMVRANAIRIAQALGSKA